jgi:hypothetical protein
MWILLTLLVLLALATCDMEFEMQRRDARDPLLWKHTAWLNRKRP